MAIFLAGSPTDNSFLPANQRLIYGLSTSTTITDAFRYIVQVFEDGTEIGKYYLAPNEAEKAFFDLGTIAKDRVEPDTSPYLDSASILFSYTTKYLTRSNGNVKKYEVKIGEYDGSSETLAQATKTIYLIGGREQTSSGLHPDFSDFYGTASDKKYWLTDYPLTGDHIEIKARDEDEGYVAFLLRNTISSVTQLVYTITYAGGVTITQAVDINTTNGAQLPTATSPTNGFLCYAAAFPATLEALGWTLTNWENIRIFPRDAVSTQKGRELRIVRDCKSRRQEATQIAFNNSRGGWDYLSFEGKRLETYTTENKPYKPAAGTWNAATFSLPYFTSEEKYFYKEASQKFTLRGIFNEEEMQVLRALFMAKKAYLRLDTWLPVLPEESSLEITKESARIFQVSFSVKLAQSLRC